jgi:hypothetical protein
LVFSSSSTTALQSTSTEIWPRSSRVCANLDFGDVSMSSIESYFQPFLSSLLRLNPSPKQRNKTSRDSCFQMRRSQSF